MVVIQINHAGAVFSRGRGNAGGIAIRVRHEGGRCAFFHEPETD